MPGTRFVYNDLGREFGRWFDWIIGAAEIYDYGRYPVKGMGVWMPYGFRLRRYVIELLREVLDSRGHEEILLPLLIPDFILAKESEHIRGFEGQVYWVTRGGFEELDVKLALRPTSETPLSYMESFWIKSYKQLPKKYYQIVSMFRYETKATRPMLRVREVTMFKEAHTVHEDFDDCERQVLEAIEAYKEFFDRLGIPYVISKRPEWDKFAGAIYTIAFDTLMPDGKALQIGTVHNLGQTFTKVFEVRIQRRDQSIDYAWQTSYGVSERVIASLISVHGDSKGLRILYEIAPIQVVIIPIPAGSNEEKDAVVKEAHTLRRRLLKEGIRAHVDDDPDRTPGEKYNFWEMKGVPIRLEIGPKELRERIVTVFRRDKKVRVRVKIEELADFIKKLGKEIDRELKRQAQEKFKSKVKMFNDVEDAKKFFEQDVGIVEIPWCGKEECASEVAEALGADALGTPLDKDVDIRGMRCPTCGAPAVTLMRYAKKY